MDEKELRALNNVLADNDGFNTILCILKMLGAFETAISRTSSSKEDYLLIGKREKGRQLLKCCFEANEEKYLELIKKGENYRG